MPTDAHINVQRFRGGLVFKAHRLGVSLNSRLESNKEEEGRAPSSLLRDSYVSDYTLIHLIILLFVQV